MRLYIPLPQYGPIQLTTIVLPVGSTHMSWGFSSSIYPSYSAHGRVAWLPSNIYTNYDDAFTPPDLWLKMKLHFTSLLYIPFSASHISRLIMEYSLGSSSINTPPNRASGSWSAKSVLTVACVYSHRVRADTNIYTLRAKCNAILVSLFWHSCLTTAVVAHETQTNVSTSPHQSAARPQLASHILSIQALCGWMVPYSGDDPGLRAWRARDLTDCPIGHK